MRPANAAALDLKAWSATDSKLWRLGGAPLAEVLKEIKATAVDVEPPVLWVKEVGPVNLAELVLKVELVTQVNLAWDFPVQSEAKALAVPAVCLATDFKAFQALKATLNCPTLT